jgi:hypothetical protein
MPNKHRRYNFHPRFYDERKENLDKKVSAHSKLAQMDEKTVREIKFKSELSDSWGNNERKSQSLKANIRLLIILVIIVVAFYYVFVGLDSGEEIINNAIKNN